MPSLTLIEPNEKSCASLKNFISNTPGWRVVGNHVKIDNALACAPAENPSVVLIDINQPGTNGLFELQRLSRKLPNAHFIVFTTFDDRESILLALNLGAHSYLLKKEGKMGLTRALRLAKDRQSYLCSEVTTVVVKSHHKKINLGIFQRLTSRQLQLTRLVHQGLDYSTVGRRLGITEPTVRQHLHHIYGRMNLRGRPALMAMYSRMMNGELEEAQ